MSDGRIYMYMYQYTTCTLINCVYVHVYTCKCYVHVSAGTNRVDPRLVNKEKALLFFTCIYM